MTERTDRQLDRFLAREISDDEEEELFRAASNDDELFEMLATATLLRNSLTATPYVPEVPAGKSRRLVFPRTRKVRAAVIAGLTAAAAAVVLVMVQRHGSVATGAPTVVSLSRSSDRPTSSMSRAAATPILLTARFVGAEDDDPTRTFRDGSSGRDAPTSGGKVTAIDDGEVTVDVGSLDGIEKGAVVRVFRGTDAAPVGSVTIARVFRDQSTGFAATASLRVGDRVELAATTQAAGLGDQVAARIAAGDPAGARAIAERAVSFARSQRLPADALRRALLRLGRLEYDGAALEPAEGHLREADAALDAAPSAGRSERAEILNALGAVLLQREKVVEAEEALHRARAQASGAEIVRVTNNLAAVAMLRGDRAEAEALYRAALAMADDASLRPERMAIAKNLESLRDPR